MSVSPGEGRGFEVRPVSPGVGAEIHGLDLGQELDNETFAAVYQAWLDACVLLFRRQCLSDPQLIAFSRRFGELDMAPINGHGQAFVEGHPEMFVISNVVEGGRVIGSLGDGECLWHTDMSYTEVPPKASCLYSLEVPDAEGDTGFLNMYAAFDSLPSDLKAAVEGRTIKHETQFTLDGYNRGDGPDLEEAKASGLFDIAQLPGVDHPIVRLHPETGRKALYLGRRQNSYVNGLGIDESDALLDRLWAHAESLDTAVWHHQWRVGDVLIWDNRCAMHRRDAFSANARRIMHRTQVKADAPPA